MRRHGVDLLIVLGAVGAALEVALSDPADGADRVAVVRRARRRVRGPGAARRGAGGRSRRPPALWLSAAALSFVDGAAGRPTPRASPPPGWPRRSCSARSATTCSSGSGCAIVLGERGDHRLQRPDARGRRLHLHPGAVRDRLARRASRCASARAEAEAAEERAEQAARLAVAEERTRIARELHDIVAHAVSVMVLQAGAVRRRLPRGRGRGGAARRRAHRPHGAGRDAAAARARCGARATRSSSGRSRGSASSIRCSTRSGGAGLPVQLHGRRRAGRAAAGAGPVRVPDHPGGADQRAEARATRRAPTSSSATRRTSCRSTCATTGAGPRGGDGLGHGLVGVRERVRIYGGEMTAGTANGGGFMLSRAAAAGGRAR